MKANKMLCKLPVLCALLLLVGIRLPAQGLADSARKAYEQSHFKQAIGYYERILSEGEASANLYYNLGNAYYKDGQPGKAIYNYELARKLNPTDDDIKTNLRIANSKIVDKVDGKENFLAGAIKSGVYGLFTTSGWAWLSIIAVAFTLFCIAGFIVSSKLFFKRVFFWLGLLGAIKFVLVFSIGYAALHNLNKKTQAIVIAQVVEVLNAPNESGKAKFSLHEGTKLSVLSTNEEWSSVQLANGNEGWVKTKDLGLF